MFVGLYFSILVIYSNPIPQINSVVNLLGNGLPTLAYPPNIAARQTVQRLMSGVNEGKVSRSLPVQAAVHHKKGNPEYIKGLRHG